jgi:hypothetical protein
MVPPGHWHPLTHCRVQNTAASSPHTEGQAVPHSVKTWPLISHAVSTGTGSGSEDGVSDEVASVDGLVGVVAVLSVAGGLVVGTGEH